jgi:hypothetical protein
MVVDERPSRPGGREPALDAPAADELPRFRAAG